MLDSLELEMETTLLMDNSQMVMFHNERQPTFSQYAVHQDGRRSTSPDIVGNHPVQTGSPSKSAGPPLDTQFTIEDGPQKIVRMQMIEQGNTFLEQHKT